MATEDSDSDEAPGWAAMNTALEAIYAGQNPRHWGTRVSRLCGGPDPLDGISAYAADQPPHWHFVTFGFSELYEKESDDPATSGFGFELTFRLPRQGDDSDEPPIWCVYFLQNLARYVFSTGNVFEPGHQFDLNGPIKITAETGIRAVSFLEDPQLGSIDSPNGHLRFVQVVGLTLDEVQALRRWDANKFLELLVTHIPLGLTDLRRASVLLDPAVREAVDRGIAAEGSSTGHWVVTSLSWHQTKRLVGAPATTVVVDALAIRDLGPALEGRIPFGRPLSIFSAEAQVIFEPASTFGVTTTTGDGLPTLRIALSQQDMVTLAALVQPLAGTYSHPALPGLSFVVERSYIRRADGEVHATVG